MINVHIRKQGGAAIMTIPSDVLKMLDIGIGAELVLEVTDNGFVAHTAKRKTRKRYSMVELLKGVTQKKMKHLNKETAWLREGESVGRELI